MYNDYLVTSDMSYVTSRHAKIQKSKFLLGAGFSN